MNRKELMELVNKREIDPYYDDKEPGRNELAWLWFVWVAIPTVVVVLAYGLYLAARGML